MEANLMSALSEGSHFFLKSENQNLDNKDYGFNDKPFENFFKQSVLSPNLPETSSQSFETINSGSFAITNLDNNDFESFFSTPTDNANRSSSQPVQEYRRPETETINTSPNEIQRKEDIQNSELKSMENRPVSTTDKQENRVREASQEREDMYKTGLKDKEKTSEEISAKNKDSNSDLKEGIKSYIQDIFNLIDKYNYLTNVDNSRFNKEKNLLTNIQNKLENNQLTAEMAMRLKHLIDSMMKQDADRRLMGGNIEEVAGSKSKLDNLRSHIKSSMEDLKVMLEKAEELISVRNARNNNNQRINNLHIIKQNSAYNNKGIHLSVTNGHVNPKQSLNISNNHSSNLDNLGGGGFKWDGSGSFLNASMNGRENSIASNFTTRFNAVTQYLSQNTQDIMSQIVKQARMAISQNKAELTMQLKPDFLGQLSMKIDLDNGILKGRILVESQQIKEMLEQNFDALKQSFEEKGITVENFDIDVYHGDSNDTYELVEMFNKEMEEAHNNRTMDGNMIAAKEGERDARYNLPEWLAANVNIIA